MRRLPAAAAAVGLLALTLVGCSASPASSCDRTAVGDIADLVSAEGDGETMPEFQVPAPLVIDELTYGDLTVGEGRAITSATQIFGFAITLFDAASGETLFTQGYDGDGGYGSAATVSSLAPGFEDALLCATGGSRVAVGLSPDEVAAGSLSGIGLAEGSAVVAVVDVREVFLAAADGAPQYSEAHGLPTVVLAPTGQPGVIVPDAAAPTERTVQLLKKGDGGVPDANVPLLVAYTVVDWDTREVSDSTWGASPATPTVGDGSVLGDVLADVPVGSQLLVVDPPAEGATTGASIYVIDLLGALG